jgi:adenylate cyclase
VQAVIYRLDVEPQPKPTSIDVIAAALEPGIEQLGRVSSPDGAVTLMLSDIADANSLSARLGPDRWELLLRDHHALVEQVLAHHGGEVIKFERDGFLASFNSAHAGLYAAVELQRTFSGPADADDGAVSLRIGLHSGFVIGHPEQLLGRNVVLASRIAGKARGGEILVSSTLKQYTEKDPSFSFESCGEHQFKGIVGEHALYAVPWR